MINYMIVGAFLHSYLEYSANVKLAHIIIMYIHCTHNLHQRSTKVQVDMYKYTCMLILPSPPYRLGTVHVAKQ